MTDFDPYRGADAPSRSAQVFNGLTRTFRELCDMAPRGVFARIHDEGLQSRLILGVVASVLAPILTEVEEHRRELEHLRRELEDLKRDRP
jgi:hypothetical protein